MSSDVETTIEEIKSPYIRIPGRRGVMRKGTIEVTDHGNVEFYPYQHKPNRERIPFMVLDDSIEENISALKKIIAALESLP